MAHGQDYGTILVDLDLHRVVDLLSDRSSESLASWLEQRPGIATIARDRCSLYAEGARIGAPEAQQVADRFHLILNHPAAVEKVFEERRRELVLPPDEEPAAPAAASACPQTSTPGPVRQQQQRRQRRLERYNEVVELFRKGYSQKAISRELSIQTVPLRQLSIGFRDALSLTSFGEFYQARHTPRFNQFIDQRRSG